MNSSFIQTGTSTTRQSGSQPRRMSSLVLYRIAKGRTRWSIEGDSYLLREGDILILLPGQIFGGVESSESALLELEWIEVRLCEGSKRLTGSALARALKCDSGDARLLVQRILAFDPPILRPKELLSRSFQQLATDGNAASDIFLRTSMLQILVGLSAEDLSEPSSDMAVRTDAESDVALFLSELESQCEELWTLESMAAGAGLKRSRFGFFCRKLTGESPAVYLNRLRIRKSRKLLAETDLSVTDIAFECGFSSSQYFAKTFRRFQGHEPTHYRRLAQEVSRVRGVKYLKGNSAKNAAFAKVEVGAGDFEITGEIMLDRLGDTAASLEFGADRFGFDGREGRFFVEGGTFGEATFFDRSADLIREGEYFPFALRRRGKSLSMEVNGRQIFSVADESGRAVGKVGLRPLRNGIRVQRFEIDGSNAGLRILGS
ncbi:MAG: AraC family transcriptional regulator [Verrucomicrobiales bacterium]|nr:AraC family transcriptional regulator [Verrucomicrobiales bacterium]